MANNESRLVTLRLTQEQLDTIQALYNHNNWELEVVRDEDRADEAEAVDLPHIVHFQQDPEADRCPHCFCAPCITSEDFRQEWWPTISTRPMILNSMTRKTQYKRFWTMLYHRGIWNLEEYLTKKTIALGRDPNRTIYVYHRRDIMPDCVLKIVRGWHPNPPDTAYMGHMWE